jgi:subtilase family serine protease
LSGDDIAKVTEWLRAQGLTVHDVARGRHWITFSGSAAQMSRAFHTEIHRYVSGGQQHFANAAELSIPAALQGIVSGVEGLDDFRLQPFYRKSIRSKPDGLAPDQNSSGGSHFLAPDDVAAIYDIAPLYARGIDGTGQKLVIVGQTDLKMTDIHAFRARFNLPPNDPQVVLYGPDPGLDQTALGEADLDLELSGAIARNATIIYVNSIYVNLSAQYAVDQNLAPVMSMSFGACEISSALTLRSIAQQANAQGITWMISSGDSGAATCDRSAPTPQAEKGATVAYPASLPEATAVGGTEFDEGSGAYWASTNSANSASAASYIP